MGTASDPSPPTPAAARAPFVVALLLTVFVGGLYGIQTMVPVVVRAPVHHDRPFDVSDDALEPRTDAGAPELVGPPAATSAATPTPERNGATPMVSARGHTAGGKVIEVPSHLRGVTSGWYHDAAGYMRGFAEHDLDGTPLLVYFGTSWCGYCRVFEAQIIGSPDARRCFQSVVKVEIDPDHGGAERALADRFGVRGYPSVFVIARPSAPPRRISTAVKREGADIAADPARFSRGCLAALAR